MTKSYTVTAWDVSDYEHSIVVQADSSDDAKAQVRTDRPGLCVTRAELTKSRKTFDVTGLVNGKQVTTRLHSVGVTDSELVACAKKFFKKLNGAYKRHDKKIVEVVSLNEVA